MERSTNAEVAMVATVRRLLIVLGLLLAASPAAAQWTQVPEVPTTTIFSVWANGDTITAGADTAVYLSTDAGTSWTRSAKPAAGVTSIQAARVRNGRLYAGTFGQGVFVSDDLGSTWQGFNQGLVGGLLDSQLKVGDLQVLGDNLYAATSGAGVYARNLTAGTWSHFGEVFEPDQASNIDALAVGGTRLLAAGGANGMVFRRDPGDGEWTESFLDNVGIHAGLSSRSIIWNGNAWVVGTNSGVFHSALGQEPWVRTTLGIGTVLNSVFAARGALLLAAYDIVNFAVIEESGDDGASWQIVDVLPGSFVYKLAMSGTELYAGRADGLWRRSTAELAVAGHGTPDRARFALVGPQPSRDAVRFRFELPRDGAASLEVFDIAGRRAGDRVEWSWPAGEHEVSWDTRGLGPGVYEALLTAGGRQETFRLVHLR